MKGSSQELSPSVGERTRAAPSLEHLTLIIEAVLIRREIATITPQSVPTIKSTARSIASRVIAYLEGVQLAQEGAAAFREALSDGAERVHAQADPHPVLNNNRRGPHP